MTQYKTFGELQKGDKLYEVEISNIDIKFKTAIVREFDEYYSNNDILNTYINESPLMFDFYKNESSWMSTIFTTKEEAIESAKQQINKKINDMCECIKFFFR